MHYQKNCKICNSKEYLLKAFTLCFHCQGYTYAQLIEMYKRNHITINQYNCSVHIQRHLAEEDFAEAEETQAKWDKADRESELEEAKENDQLQTSSSSF